MGDPTIRVGHRLEPLVRGPVSRGTLALFAGASNDHVLLHIDSDFAKAAGMPDVFGHGMLTMAYLGQLLTRNFGLDRLRGWQVRFTAITPLHATVTATGEVIELFEIDGERRARLRLQTRTDQDVVTLEGEATVAIEGVVR